MWTLLYNNLILLRQFYVHRVRSCVIFMCTDRVSIKNDNSHIDVNALMISGMARCGASWESPKTRPGFDLIESIS